MLHWRTLPYRILTIDVKGIESTHIVYHPDYSAEDDDPLQGVRFVVSPSLGKHTRPHTE